ncbi:MAG: hypothetical protein JWM47_198 [Acidimicrobiales bacterium]|nr:hypothetical protein [Acidimicrobiales bacterium]
MAVVGFLILVGVLAAPAVARYGPDHLGGQTRRIALDWDCWNHIEWSQPGTSWTWVGSVDDKQPSKLATSERKGDWDWPTQVATGAMHFTSHSRATFTSDAGGTLLFERHREPFFRKLSCAMPSVPPNPD